MSGIRVLGVVALGALTALAELVFLLVTLPFLAQRKVRAAAVRLALFEARRLGIPDGELEPRRREVRYLALRAPVGIMGGVVLGLLVIGAVTGVRIGWTWSVGESFDGMAPTVPIVVYLGLLGLVLLFLDLSGVAGVHALERRLARRLLGPDTTEALRRRIAELAESRAGIVAAVDSERRRIERDLHDGLQQRLVALSMLVGRARRGRPELLEQAHEQAQQALAELREVAWRVYPSALDALGLGEALAGVAERAGIPVHIRSVPRERLPMAVETVAYFVVSEAVTNAAKHAGAARITVDIHREDSMITVRVEDDGAGGAVATGGGLSGLARRVAALDGRFEVTSPAGGPTTITARLPERAETP